jgi:hypothetical protein
MIEIRSELAIYRTYVRRHLRLAAFDLAKKNSTTTKKKPGHLVDEN